MQKNPNKESESGFISRWSRRKTAMANKLEVDALNTISEAQTANEMVAPVTANPELTDKINRDQEKAFTDEDMPPLDSLTEDSDFSRFMSPGVSDTLRNLALRKLFGGASFNIRDGLDDYDDDFRSFAALGELITCDMKHQMEMEDERKRKQEEAEAADAVVQSDEEEIEADTDADQEVDAKSELSLTEEEPIDDGENKKVR